MSAGDWLLPLVFLALLPALVINATAGLHGLRPAVALMRRRMQVYTSYPFAVFATLLHGVVLVVVVAAAGRYFFPELNEVTIDSDRVGLLTYLTVGLVAWPAIWEGYELTQRNVRAEQTTGIFETLLATPVGVRVLPVAYLFMTLPVAILVASVAYFLFTHYGEVDLPIHTGVQVLTVVLVLATGVFMTWGLGLFLGGLTTIHKETGPLGGILKMVMLVFSDIYIPIGIFPQPVQYLSNLLPLTWAFAAIRNAFSGAPLTADLTTYLVFFAYTLLLILGGIYVFSKSIERARRDGTTAGY